ncbi:TPA: hypothetical protein DCF80_00720 [Candidatus Saccharibacteria bacterium]|nr:hypothetical protein [Candidatus Saccharibacteria bacterium]HRK40838.1 DHH family phosphoesterase [Candidatus Saccharibacteria bacterium]
MYDTVKTLVDDAKNIVVIQPENPDGDSLASSLALEAMLEEQGKTVSQFCAIDMPKYLRYINGWDRVTSEWDGKYDLAIIVDTSAEALLQKALATSGLRHFLESHPVLVFDHHVEADEGNDLTFEHTLVQDDSAASTGELLVLIAKELGWTIDQETAENLFISLAADTLGLTTPSVTLRSFETATELVRLGAVPANIELRRREMMRKPADILEYKGKLIERIEYLCDGRLALIHIPWEDIQAYSDRYNPSVLVLDEMRLVEGVDVAIAIKTYPDGKLTGKIRANVPLANQLAGYFGGGGHPYSAGFKIHESLEETRRELATAFHKLKVDDATA